MKRPPLENFYPILLAGMVVVSFGIMVGALTRILVTVAAPVAVPPPAVTKISLQQFKEISLGMNIRQVQQVMGSTGKLLVAHAQNKVYIWQNADGSNAVIEFKDDQVVSKLQAGLPEP